MILSYSQPNMQSNWQPCYQLTFRLINGNFSPVFWIMWARGIASKMKIKLPSSSSSSSSSISETKISLCHTIWRPTRAFFRTVCWTKEHQVLAIICSFFQFFFSFGVSDEHSLLLKVHWNIDILSTWFIIKAGFQSDTMQSKVKLHRTASISASFSLKNEKKKNHSLVSIKSTREKERENNNKICIIFNVWIFLYNIPKKKKENRERVKF